MADDPKLPEDEELPDETENEVEDEGENAGLVDDESGDETEAGQELEGAEAQERVERQPSRAQKAVLEAKRVAREASERAERVERELSELRAERERSRAETPEQENARLALMTLEERVEYKLNKATAEHERKLNMMQFASADAADKAAFEAKAAYDKYYKTCKDEVEQLLAVERRQGRNFPRETILDFVLGRKFRQNAGKITAQRAQGQERIRRQTTPAPRGGSDRQAQRNRTGTGDTLADLEKRLEGVFI